MLHTQDGCRGMPVIGCRYDEGIKIPFFDQFPDILYYGGFPGGILQSLQAMLDGRVFHIADIGNFHIGQTGKTTGQVGTAAVDPHHSHGDFIAGRISSK